jgi:DNA-binding response OmpR family regulator
MSTIKNKNILLVDDEPDITFTLKDILENTDFNVDSFTDPVLALDKYKSNFYDLVILDIKMPKINGFQLYIKLKEKDPKAKICFLTASELFYEEYKKIRSEWEKKIGEEYFIQKPIKIKDLIRRITAIINE